MDPANKNSSQKPESVARAGRIVVALSGGLDSFVAAYLLKIQKFDLIGLTVVNDWGESIPETGKLLSCHIGQSRLDSIKAFCDEIQIPHLLVSGKNSFQEEVIENWVSAKLTGLPPQQCWDCHDLRMRLLFQKMQALGGRGLATGHFAKVFRNDSTGSVFVHTSNDEASDQSPLLSRLPHGILDKLILPLSDLKRTEVEKLGQNFGLRPVPGGGEIHRCLPVTESTLAYLERHVPKALLRGGDIFGDLGQKEHLGKHLGVIHYQRGKPVRDLEYPRSAPYGHMIDYSFRTKRMIVGDEEELKKPQILLHGCKVAEGSDWAMPIKGAAKFGDGRSVDCWVSPKVFNGYVLEFDGPEHVVEGEIVTVLRKKGKNVKVLLTGKVRYPAPVAPSKEDEVHKVDRFLQF